MLLNDKTIRAALIARLLKFPVKPKAILEELRVHNGNAIADVVAINSFAHCYEIKGETDSIYRIARQAAFYDRAFTKTTLVTTPGQIKKASQLVPLHWGILQASHSNGKLIFGYVRSAGTSPVYDSKAALLTLWRAELLDVATALGNSTAKLNRTQLTEMIALRLGKRRLTKTIGEKLQVRQASPYSRDM